MAITLLGADGLNDLMDTDVRISVANRTRAAVPVTIVAALVVLHDETARARSERELARH